MHTLQTLLCRNKNTKQKAHTLYFAAEYLGLTLTQMNAVMSVRKPPTLVEVMKAHKNIKVGDVVAVRYYFQYQVNCNAAAYSLLNAALTRQEIVTGTVAKIVRYTYASQNKIYPQVRIYLHVCLGSDAMRNEVESVNRSNAEHPPELAYNCIACRIRQVKLFPCPGYIIDSEVPLKEMEAALCEVLEDP